VDSGQSEIGQSKIGLSSQLREQMSKQGLACIVVSSLLVALMLMVACGTQQRVVAHWTAKYQESSQVVTERGNIYEGQVEECPTTIRVSTGYDQVTKQYTYATYYLVPGSCRITKM